MSGRIWDKGTAAASSVPEFAVLYWPGPVGRRLRYWYFKRRLKHLGRDVIFEPGAQILNPGWVSIGDNSLIDFYSIIIAGPPSGSLRKVARKPNPFFRGSEGEVHIGKNCHVAPYSILQGHGGVWIGDNASVAAGVRVYSYSHHYRDLSCTGYDPTLYKFSPMVPPDEQALIKGAVVLEDNSGVGLDSVVLPGSTIQEYSWLGACSLLAGTIRPGVIAQGNPAREIKERWPAAP